MKEGHEELVILLNVCIEYSAYNLLFIMVFFICYFLYLQKRSKANKKKAHELTSVFSPTL